MRAALGFLYVLAGGVLYQEDRFGNQTICTGASIPSSGVAMMTDNGVQLTVLSAGLCFTVVGTTIAQITSPAFPAAGVGSIDTMDGFTIFSTAITNPSVVYAPSINITAITQANPAQVTSANHGLSNNQQVLIQSVVGMTQVNNRQFTVRVVDVNNFQLIGIDSTGYTSYSSGGTAKRIVAQGTGQWFISALYDSSTIDALQFAAAESLPDALLRAVVINRELWLFGERSIEPWQDVGSAPFPFQRVTGAVMDRGTAAALSPAELNGMVFWLGDDLVVYMATGYQPQRISNYAVEEFLRKAQATTGVSDAFGMVYTQAGHSFYILTLPSFGMTFCYDIVTELWHERWSGTQLTPAVWNVTCMAKMNNTIYVGVQNGQVGILDLDTFTELGAPIRSAARTPPLYNDGKRATNPVLELEGELGVGLLSGRGSVPQVMIRWSDDGGSTWSNQRTVSIGVTADRVDRAIVRRMGLFRQREYEFSISDPVKRAFYGYRFEPVGANS